MEGKKEQSEYYKIACKYLNSEKLKEVEDDILIINDESIEISSRMKEFVNKIGYSEFNFFNSDEKLIINHTCKTPDAKVDVIKKVKQFAYYRLYYYLTKSEDKKSIKNVVFETFLEGLIKMSKSENYLFIPLMLHASRGLIDTHEVVNSAVQCIQKSFEIKLFDKLKTEKKLNYLEDTLTKLNSVNEINEIKTQILEIKKKLTMSSFYDEGVEFFKKTLDRQAGKKAIETFLRKFGNNIKLDDAIENTLKNINFQLIENVPFIAMTGFNKTVYFDISSLNNKNDKYSISRTVSNCYHEAAHILIRYHLNDDFGIITPRQNDEKELEAGYLMENILFGTYSFPYWTKTKIIEEKEWDREILPLYKEEEYKIYQKRGINCFRSGLEYEEGKIQFE
jgi:hypothetical protein